MHENAPHDYYMPEHEALAHKPLIMGLPLDLFCAVLGLGTILILSFGRIFEGIAVTTISFGLGLLIARADEIALRLFLAGLKVKKVYWS